MTSKEDKTAVTAKPSRWLMDQARQARTLLSLAIVCGIASGLLLILQASLLAHIINAAFILHVGRDQLLLPLSGFILFIVCRAGLSWAKEVAGFKAGALIRKKLRMAILHHMSELGPVHSQQWQTGAITSSIIEQVEAVQNFYANYLPQMALVVFLPVSILAFIFPLNWIAGLLLFITAPLIPLFMALIGMGVELLNQRHFQSLATMSAHFLDILQGMTTLKLFNRSRDQAAHIARSSDEYRQRTMSVLRVAFMSSGCLELFSSVAIALLAVYLGLCLIGEIHAGTYSGHLSLSTALFILLLAPEFYLPLRDLGTHYHARAEAIAAAKEMNTILTVQPDPRPKKTIMFPATNTIKLRFEKMSFHYKINTTMILDDINFSINAGEHVAIIGTSGAGKTSLLNLIMLFLRPSKGRILANNLDITQLDLAQWRQKISWLGQNPRLFPGSIRDNIFMANPRATRIEFNTAIQKAQVMPFALQLPQGLDTQLGEQNLGLSGGQAQRIALARAYLKAAPILLLDEPTASLDTDNEKMILQSLHTLKQNRTVISVSHRLDTIKSADKIFMLKHGQLKELDDCTSIITAMQEATKKINSETH